MVAAFAVEEWEEEVEAPCEAEDEDRPTEEIRYYNSPRVCRSLAFRKDPESCRNLDRTAENICSMTQSDAPLV